MKKSEIATYVVLFIMLIAAGLLFFFVVPDVRAQYAPQTHWFLFPFLNIVIALAFNVIMLEVLHLIGGLIGGYSIAYVCIAGLCFEKKEKGIKLGFKNYDGLSGETKLAPKKEKVSLKPYVWLPFFGFAAELASCIVIYSNFKETVGDNSWLAASAIIFIIISSIMAFYNLFPMQLDSTTDGYRMVLMMNQTNLDAYNELLRVEELQRTGKETTDIKVFEDITEFTANINLFAIYNLLKENDLSGAEEIIDKCLKDTKKLEPYTHYHLICQKLYINLMTKDSAEGKALYDQLADDKARRYIANDASMESIRAYILISGLLEKSEGEVKFAIQRKKKALKKTPQSRVEIEEKLYQDAINKVYEAHPNWDKEKAAA